MRHYPRALHAASNFFPTKLFERRLSVMEMTKTDSLKEELMSSNPEFRELAREHGRYEQRLSELSALAYPSDEEQLEEVTLKKKKLAIKEKMYALIHKYEKVVNEEQCILS